MPEKVVFRLRLLLLLAALTGGAAVIGFCHGLVFYDLIVSAYLLFLIILLPIFLFKVQWYEPIVAVNVMLFIFVLDLIYLSMTGFSHAEHLLHGYGEVLAISGPVVLFSGAWLLFFTLGYFLLRRAPNAINKQDPIVPVTLISPRPLQMAAALGCLAIAAANLFYNIWLFSPGNPLAFFMEFGVARHRVQVNAGWFTTLGYNFFIVALVLYRTAVGRWRTVNFVFYMAMLLLSLLAIVSRGQIFFTFSVVIFLLVFECMISTRRRLMLSLCVIFLPALIMVVLFAYAMRLVSVELFLAAETGQALDVRAVVLDKLANIAHLIFGKGNVPNLPAMLVYWEHYNQVEGWLNGRSMFSWLHGFVPGYAGTFIGYHISDIWYPNNVGGIPPGIVMEFYSNFGVVGALLAATLLGLLSAMIFNAFMEKRTIVWCVIYCALLTRFWFIAPKVEMATLNNAIWLFAPTVVAILILSKLSVPVSKMISLRSNDSSIK
ncbi:hypothetical protein [Marinobacter sp. SS21]|uniref:hypothetical protein n=1 Tax=Marinobacter sp. SS21 TaxID=2979460 RepID=UPI00232C40FF|nr:hypothetical protein [Marinobacter sp. SS21]MDC0664173.1 hypothetical protein [Marinobacter sp. SS21]